jgi:hypothetical protein
MPPKIKRCRPNPQHFSEWTTFLASLHPSIAGPVARAYTVVNDPAASVSDWINLKLLDVPSEHPLRDWNCLRPDTRRKYPQEQCSPSWWIINLIERATSNLAPVDWDIVDRQFCGQIGASIAKAFITGTSTLPRCMLKPVRLRRPLRLFGILCPAPTMNC